MSYFRYIDKGEGPTKLFIGGVHGNEGVVTLDLVKRLTVDDFCDGQIYIYNFDRTPYISTLKEDFYKSEQGRKIISLIKYYKPDFYTELHSYNISHFNRLIGNGRWDAQGVPPLIDCGNHALCSSVSPLIRRRYFTRYDICQTLEFPAIRGDDRKLSEKELEEKYGFNRNASIEEYMKFLRLITISKDRSEFEKLVLADYPKQVDLAIKYVKQMYDDDFPQY